MGNWMKEYGWIKKKERMGNKKIIQNELIKKEIEIIALIKKQNAISD